MFGMDSNTPFPRAGMKPGTGRTRELLDRLGCPDKKLNILHVAGSNGKGSVCAYLSHILREGGLRTGMFTSPAVFDRGECFAIDCLPAPRDILQKYTDEARSAAAGMADAPSPFELDTCTALAMFAGEGCTHCVLECGLGGLEDATNAVSRKSVAVITSIALEHTDILGATIADICRHKGGIIRDCPAVVPDDLPDEAAAYFAARGAIAAGGGLQILSRTEDCQRFTYGGSDYAVRMYGDGQLKNAAVAIECAKLIGIPQDAVARGLYAARLPGRVQPLRAGGRLFILDGAHNPGAFGPLMQFAGGMEGTKSLVYSCLSDKDVEGCAAVLAPVFGEVNIVPAPGGRGMDTAAIAAAFEKNNVKAHIFADVPAALAAASGDTVAVCGTFTILKEAKQWIGQGQ